MNISEVVKRAALKWVQATTDDEATEVTDFETETRDGGYCETCSYSYVVVAVWYKTRKYKLTKVAEYEGGFAEFICKLDEYDI